MEETNSSETMATCTFIFHRYGEFGMSLVNKFVSPHTLSEAPIE